ncbi:MAG: TetR/AcrR family transcriptional regulator [Lachnospiraceae bacterium]|jgi:AcrR family transcriptional regulator|uniref:TetR/AcrR family transcriptional regulator n=1 Tax=Candidatus Merdisoma sp. JLR.KK011 TaxID=3114299 RepID=UPI0029D75DEE|nr:TetR/AcrR family transcriptional regulator [Lachnospiraceae bacterium]MCI9251646.1 TetR/AcrR family transcriptional regulator [Lachnospiraceae bacterium]MCI9479272.1 TetR/AcrR family transcriptional regulator [Lachnospiraceae bacterium]MCI9622859.1 TetR/AcrR family transcriptional regulator [Lachnospiraceae bacterium]
MEKSRNPKNIFVKECLFTALLILMQSKNFHEITVTELTKKAGVSRMAFYRNYETIEDIIIDYFNTTKLGINENNADKIMYLPNMILRTCEFFYANQELMNDLIHFHMTDLILNAIEAHFHSTFYLLLYSYGFQSDYEISALVGIFFKILIDWTKNGMTENIEQMSITIYDIMTKFDNY